MGNNQNHQINFVTAYRQALQAEKKPVGRFKKLLPLLLLCVLAAALAGAYGLLRLENARKTEAIAAASEEIDALSDEYAQAIARASYADDLDAMVSSLEAVADETVQPRQLDRDIFERILACAGDAFEVSVYRYHESTGLLEIDAAASSVNDVPQFVEDLRGTRLFGSVQYVGYTSDTDGTYYCTIGCMLTD